MEILTIGMPVFNDAAFIERSLISILGQTCRDFVLIVSDDGSTDGSEAICRKYAQADARLIYIRQEKNLGISKNMMFLLQQARTKYFMWAGDDDLWDAGFAEKLMGALQADAEAVCSFSPYHTIDENDKVIDTRNFNYAHPKPWKRLLGFIKNADDGFGYGLFLTEKIRGVEFPVWWWPNKKSAYNNIFPSLCFYLTKGNYIHYAEPLFYKRVKTEANTHHKIAFQNHAVKETFAYLLRRFYLAIFSCKMIAKAGNLGLAIGLCGPLLHYWFVKPGSKQIVLAAKSFAKNRL